MKWFHSDGHTQTYIPKKHREYAQQLAYKRFLLEKQTECKKELYALELYQRHAVGENKKSDRFLSEDPAYQEFHIFSTFWMNESYCFCVERLPLQMFER